MAYLESSQEEADTKLLLHAIDASTSGATSIDIISPDTDVFVLALIRFPELCQNTFFVTGRVPRHRKILFSPIVQALGPARTAAPPGFHTWSELIILEASHAKESWGIRKHFLRLTRIVSQHLQIWVQPCNQHQVPLLQLRS